MLNIRKLIFSGLITMFASPLIANELLHGEVTVNISSDTAVNAKNIAFDEARRQILSDSLRQYADVDTLTDAIKNADSADLANMVSASTIGDEQSSNTTYSARISISFDAAAVRGWLTDNQIQNWLPDTSVQDSVAVIVNMSANRLSQWIELTDIARTEKIDIQPQKISGNVINLVIPVDKRGAFTIALRERGWKYADIDGALRIWK